MHSSQSGDAWVISSPVCAPPLSLSLSPARAAATQAATASLAAAAAAASSAVTPLTSGAFVSEAG